MTLACNTHDLRVHYLTVIVPRGNSTSLVLYQFLVCYVGLWTETFWTDIRLTFANCTLKQSK